jgi:flagellar biosynthesis GTPase FlhF
VTYRGRSLEEVLPKIREELGPDAVIERQRTGLVGGVGGFFQREMIEVDARSATGIPSTAHGTFDVLAGAEDEDAALRAAIAPPPDPDRDEGFTAPAMRRIAEQAEPFADLLADAEHDERQLSPAGASDPAGPAEHDWDAWAEDLGPDEADDLPAPPHQAPYRPPAAGRHVLDAYQRPDRSDDPATAPHPPAAFLPAPTPASPSVSGPPAAPAFTAPDAPPAGARKRPAAADAAERALTDHGLSPALAASVVGEAVSHAAPFAAGTRGGLKKVVRATLARRIPVQAGFGGAGRTLALVGAAGAGKTRAIAGLAAAYAANSDLPVVVLSLRPADVGAELRELLDPHGVSVRPVEDGAAARAHIGARAGSALVLVDTPAVSPRDRAAIARLGADLREAGVTETHVVLSATVAGPVAREAVGAFAPLEPAALLVTHADETDHLGALVDLAVAEGRPLSYLAGPEPTPVDPVALAARLLP